MSTGLQMKPLSQLVKAGGVANGSPKDERQQLLRKAEKFFARARQLAADGDVVESGLVILKGLDCERRAKAHGPQVLGLIRKRV